MSTETKQLSLKDYKTIPMIAEDSITGFGGIVIGHRDFITGCDQYFINPRAGEDNIHPKGHWFDEGRLKVLGKAGFHIDEIRKDIAKNDQT